MKRLKWYQRFRSIQSSMTFAFVCVISLTIAVSSTISFYFVRLSARDSAVAYTEQIISQINQNIEYYVKEMDNVSSVLTRSFDVREYYGDEANPLLKKDYYNRIQLTMDSLLDSREDITSASLFGYNNDVIVYKEKIINPYTDFTKSDWYKGAFSENGVPYVTASYVQNIYEGTYHGWCH